MISSLVIPIYYPSIKNDIQMNLFDTSIIHFLIQSSQNSPALTSFMTLIVDNSLLKGCVVVSILWYLWFRKSDQVNLTRERVMISVICCIIAIFVGRLLARVLPFRLRPLVDQNLEHFYHNKSMADSFDMVSSFPSDHAVMFFALATGIFLISKKLGTFAYLYVLFVVCFPRIYLGLHYPTDILTGAVVGIITSLLLASPRLWRPVTGKILQISNKYTGMFYVFFFLFSFEISTLFDSLRSIVHFLFGGLYESMLGPHGDKMAQIFIDSMTHFHQLF
jgi:undecaprenyl-diphosphatase